MTDLRKLSEAATPGEWATGGNSLYSDGNGFSDIFQCSHGEGGKSSRQDAAFIVALVNEFRSGSLIPRPEYERALALLAEARAGLNEADRFLSDPLDPDDVICASDEIKATLSRIDDALAAEPEAKA